MEMVDASPFMKFVWNSLMVLKNLTDFLTGNEITQSHVFHTGKKKLSSPVLEKKLTYANIFP